MKYASLLIICFLSLCCFAQKKSPRAFLTGNYTLVKQKVGNKLLAAGGSKTKISIDQSRETIKCNLGCNSISADFSAISGEVEQLQLISTEKVCSAKLRKLERQFMKNMNRVNKYRTFKNMLYLSDGEEILVVLRRRYVF